MVLIIKWSALCTAPTGPGNMSLPRSKDSRMVLWKGKLTDQGQRPVWQRQSRARAERVSWFCSVWLSKTKNWPLPCRDSPEREEREIPDLFWNRFLVLFGNKTVLKSTFYIWRGIWFFLNEDNIRYIWSWSCKSWIFYKSFTVRWVPSPLR